MPVSVIVASYNAGQLRQCLEVLNDQPDAHEVIVSDCSTEDPAIALAPAFPRVRFLHFPEKKSIPQLRWAGMRESTGPVIACVEARSVPAADWCALLVRAHAGNPDAPAVGGPVALSTPASARDEGLYFCEYGHVAPPVRPGPAHELSGANVSYKREALKEMSDLIEAGRWETLLHRRWREQGRPLLLSTATVYFRNAMSLTSAIRQRFAYGRGYAAARFDGGWSWRHAVYAAGCLVLPFLLTVRLGYGLGQKRRLSRFWRALPWIVLFNGVWASGELTGYLFGESGRDEIY